MTYFSELGLAEPILRALDAKGYADPTPIQREAIPALLQGRDLLGIAQTGTGKTAAFALPSLHRLAETPSGRFNAGCRMLVLSPTRELAAQIADNMRGYARYLDLSVQCVFGGVPVGKQARALTRGCDILVATPGRLLDLIDQRALTLRHVEIFVLDEADQMMDLGFIKPLTRIAALLPEQRQSLFFSATMPKAIAELGKRFIKNPVRVEVAPQSTTAERVEQFATFVDQGEKQALLTLSLRAGLADNSVERALVFTRTKHGADRVVRHLVSAGIQAAAIHGNKSQAQRTAALGAFRSGRMPVLVATDIAARGIDVSGVSHVFNFELPNVAEQYVHRIGRTARAGADGMAVSYVARDEKGYLRDIERLTGVQLGALPLPEGFREEMGRLPAPARPKPEQQGERRADGGRGRTDRRGAGGSAERRGDRPRNDRPRNDRPREDRGGAVRGEHRRTEHARTEHPRTERPRTEHGRPEHRRAEHGRNENGRNEHRRAEHGRSEHARNEHGRNEHTRGEQGDDARKRHFQGRRKNTSGKSEAAARSATAPNSRPPKVRRAN